jgi:intracellular sulfur oxidation DsrE/DsrF family protein
MKLVNLTMSALLVGLVSMPTLASGNGNTECPVGLVSGLTLDDEFGPDTQELTKCIKKRHQVKVVVQINQYGSDSRAYALGNIENIVADYEITHGMMPGRDYEIVGVIHSAGGRLALKDTGLNSAGVEISGRNPHEAQMKALMDAGVKFYFCQNTTRAYMGQPPASITSLPKYLTTGFSATDQLIPGMLYTTAGVSAIADYQAQGYQYIQP